MSDYLKPLARMLSPISIPSPYFPRPSVGGGTRDESQRHDDRERKIVAQQYEANAHLQLVVVVVPQLLRRTALSAACWLKFIESVITVNVYQAIES